MASATDPSFARTFTTVDNTRYGYILRPPTPGSPTFLLLHGFCSSVYDWRHVLPLLSRSGAGILAPDLLGYGDTDSPADPACYRMRRMSSHISALCASHGLSKVIGVGHDWGSGLLGYMWNFEPSLFSRLVFISLCYLPPAPLDIPAINAITKAQLGYEAFGYWDFLVADDSPALLEKKFETFQRIGFARDPDAWTYALAPAGALRHWIEQDRGLELELAEWADESEMETHRNIILQRGLRGPTNWLIKPLIPQNECDAHADPSYRYRAMVHGINESDQKALTPTQSNITVPVLYVATLGDRVCVPDLMKKMMRPYVEYMTVRDIDAGHWVLIEKPSELVDAIQSVLEV